MQWTFQPVGGLWFTTLVVAVLLALVLVVPRPRPSGGKLWTLCALRLAIVLLVFVSLLRPTLTRIDRQPVESSLLLLIDESRSLQVADSLGGATRWQAARRMLADSADALRKLDSTGDVRAFRFGDEVAEVEVVEGRVTLPDDPQSDASAIGAAIEETLDRAGDDRLVGVVLLSDGAQRATPPNDQSPQVAVRRLLAEGVPLYTATLGQPGVAGRADLAIEDLTASESAFVKAPTEVAARLRATGFANRTVTVQLLWENKQGQMQAVDAQRVEIGPQGGTYPLRLGHTPLVAGEQKITVAITSTAEGANTEELITSNNQQSTFITVRDGGVKVLYLAGAQRKGGVPGLEQRFVRSALAASPDVVVSRRVFDYRQLRRELTLDPELGTPDVILIDNLDSTALDESSWRSITNRVTQGAGLAMIGGRQSFGPGGYAGNPLARVLPLVMVGAERQRLGEPRRRDVHLEGPFGMRPARPFGMGHPLLQIRAEPDASLWSELPKLDGANRFDRGSLKPNAMVLAETDDRAGRPLVVVGQAGRGRVYASAVDTTWRWQLEGFGDAHRRYWRQVVLWLAKKDDTTQSPVWVELDSRQVARGARLDLRFGSNASSAAEPTRYEAFVLTPDGRRVDLATGSAEEFATVFTETGVPGDYSVQVIGQAGEKKLGQAEARFSVPDQDLELDNPAAEPSIMAQLAAMTSAAGGRAIAPEELPDLLNDFAERDPEMEEEVVSRITHWDTWPFFLLLVTLLGAEWYLRKRWGLV